MPRGVGKAKFDTQCVVESQNGNSGSVFGVSNPLKVNAVPLSACQMKRNRLLRSRACFKQKTGEKTWKRGSLFSVSNPSKVNAVSFSGFRIGVCRTWHGPQYCGWRVYTWSAHHFEIRVCINYNREVGYFLYIVTFLHCSTWLFRSQRPIRVFM